MQEGLHVFSTKEGLYSFHRMLLPIYSRTSLITSGFKICHCQPGQQHRNHDCNAPKLQNSLLFSGIGTQVGSKSDIILLFFIIVITILFLVPVLVTLQDEISKASKQVAWTMDCK